MFFDIFYIPQYIVDEQILMNICCSCRKNIVRTNEWGLREIALKTTVDFVLGAEERKRLFTSCGQVVKRPVLPSPNRCLEMP